MRLKWHRRSRSSPLVLSEVIAQGLPALDNLWVCLEGEMKSKRTHKNNNTFNEQETRKKLIDDCMYRFGPEGVRQLKLLFGKIKEE